MLVIVLISLFAFGCEVQAKSDQSIDRNRRDAQSFYKQIKTASMLVNSCDQSSCAALADPSVCPGFCKKNETLIDRALRATSKCLNMVPCNLQQWQVNDVKIPIAVDGYDGVCSLNGNVTVSGGSYVRVSGIEKDEHDSNSFPSYKMYLGIVPIYSGLSVTCSPCTSSSGGSGNKLLSQILGLVNLGDGGSSGSKFSASVTVTQTYIVNFVNAFFSSSTTELYRFSATTSVELGSGVPAEYEDQVAVAVKIPLDNFELIYNVCDNYVENVRKALQATFDTTCLKTDCEKT